MFPVGPILVRFLHTTPGAMGEFGLALWVCVQRYKQLFCLRDCLNQIPVDTCDEKVYVQSNYFRNPSMKAKILIGIIVVMVVCPPPTHAFGLLKYAFDAIANQLGLDRGPIPKVMQKAPDQGNCPSGGPPATRPVRNLHIQAEGF